MNFDLKRYINENYLNEKLQSRVIIDELLNDTGGMFKYYKTTSVTHKYDSTSVAKTIKIKQLHKKLRTLYNELLNVCAKYPHERELVDGVVIDSDETARKVYENYVKLLDKYLDMVSKEFDKPEPKVLATVLNGCDSWGDFMYNHEINLFNITDDFFEKHTLAEYKKSVDKTDIDSLISNNTVFWLTEDKKIQCVSILGRIILYAIDNTRITRTEGNRISSITFNDIKKSVKPENNITRKPVYLNLKDGTKLELYGVINQNDWEAINYIDVLDKITLSRNIGHRNSKKDSDLKFYNIKNIASKASAIQKYTDWGKSPNDYFIIYKPKGIYGNEITSETTIDDTSVQKMDMMYSKSRYGYNDIKINRDNALVQAHKTDVTITKLYTWVKNILGKYKPYAGGKDSKYFEYGKILTLDDFYHIYGDDERRNAIASTNFKRLQTAASVIRACNVTEEKEKLEGFIKSINTYNNTAVQLVDKIKNIDDLTAVSKAVALYGVYMNNIQEALRRIAICKNTLNSLNIELKSVTKTADALNNYKKSINLQVSGFPIITERLDAAETEIQKILESEE